MSTAARVSEVLPDRRRQLGAYYTPEALAGPMVTWALHGLVEPRVLDPSHGGGVFLSQTLDHVGRATASTNVFGVDIDDSVQRHESGLIARGIPTTHLVRRDFLDLKPRDFEAPFDSIVGNPPYIRHHMLSESTKSQRRLKLKVAGHSLDGRADLWAYFLFHSCGFLRAGGRLAFVLPGSFLQADYSKSVRDALAETFRSVTAVRLRERVFVGAAETSVVLLAEGYNLGPTQLVLLETDTVTSFSKIVARQLHRDTVTPKTLKLAPAKSLAEEAASLLDETSAGIGAGRLERYADVRIGVVTGANQFFIRPLQEVGPLLGPGVTTRAIVSRSRDLEHPRFRPADLSSLETNGNRSRLLLIDDDAQINPDLRRELDEGERDNLHLRSHPRRRVVWYAITDDSTPDALLPYMGSNPPTIVLNDARALCTNGVHRLFWKDADSTAGLVASSWTSLFEMAAELQGRRYGGGVLKVEPSDAKGLPVMPIESGDEVLAEIDRISRGSSKSEARKVADQLVLREALGLGANDVLRLRQTLTKLREQRSGRLQRVG